ncbi:MAG TPA: iron uptake transporter deferrochelatase/peroxidase subunit [Frankiaceae bacterium]|jgi:deferrochelatase/peroxidase EfeB
MARFALSRRQLLGGAAAGAAATVAGAGLTACGIDGGAAPRAAGAATVPFHGVHQAGIATPAQDRLHFVAFDLTTTDRAEVVALLREWTAAARAMTAGRAVGGGAGGHPAAPPDDTGEAEGLPAANLTLTVGFGPGLFTSGGVDRYGLAARRPAALADLPAFPGDALRPERSGGDLAVQACADDPQVAVHAIRNLARIARGAAEVRWSQLGFGRTSSTSRSQATPRNLFGFKDGTANLKVEDAALLGDHVWADGSGPGSWMRGGSYLVARRIGMRIEVWDRSALAEQERAVGRTKAEGAPLSGGTEFTALDLAGTTAAGAPAIPLDAHVRLAAPETNNGARLLRRGYSYVDGSDGLGRLDAGLFFLAYQKDPRTGFIPVQQRLAGRGGDALNEYLTHTGSAVFACPPGVVDGADWWGRALFA